MSETSFEPKNVVVEDITFETCGEYILLSSHGVKPEVEGESGGDIWVRYSSISSIIASPDGSELAIYTEGDSDCLVEDGFKYPVAPALARALIKTIEVMRQTFSK